MHPITFYYDINNEPVQVVAHCKAIINGDTVEGLTLTFLNSNDDRIKIQYDKDLFEELECVAMEMLAEEYYNPSVRIGH